MFDKFLEFVLIIGAFPAMFFLNFLDGNIPGTVMTKISLVLGFLIVTVLLVFGTILLI